MYLKKIIRESLNWSDKDTINWDKDKSFSEDPNFSSDPNWTTSPEKSYWVQGSAGSTSQSGPGSSGEGETMGEEDGLDFSDDFNWVKDIAEHPNYNGHPQGVVYLHDHDEINEFCDIIENYNGGKLPRGNVRINLHQALEDSRDEMEGSDYDPYNAVISASFFVEKKVPGLLSVGYWGYSVYDDGIRDWLAYGDTYNQDYHLYINLSQVREIFDNYQNPELINESEKDGFDWIRDMEIYISPIHLNPSERYKITSLKGNALESYMEDGDLNSIDPYDTIFVMDSSECFQDKNGKTYDYYEDGLGIRQVWLIGEDDPQEVRGWVEINGMTVVKIY